MIIFNLLVECYIINYTLCLLQRSFKFFVCEFVQVYEWLGRFVICRDTMAKLLVAFQEETCAILQIHSIRWLSHGLVMERFTFCMLTILEAWKSDEPTWHHNITFLQF